MTGTRKIVLGRVYGILWLTPEQGRQLRAEGLPVAVVTDEDGEEFVEGADAIARDDSRLVALAESLKPDEYGATDLFVVEIPADVDWVICHGERGTEWVAERHRTWGY